MNKGWIGVDLDGTLAEYDDWKGETHIGEPILPMVTRVREWLRDGVEVKIFTARVCEPLRPGVLEAIQDWTEKYLGRRLPVTNVKDYDMIELWDDRAIQIIQNTGLRADQYFVKK